MFTLPTGAVETNQSSLISPGTLAKLNIINNNIGRVSQSVRSMYSYNTKYNVRVQVQYNTVYGLRCTVTKLTVHKVL